ncbi:MAG: glycosyltransferase [Candidatus Omnitrophica bacterium]|nr:glycosyltransferase [Candidatus Omnitrophota bacterium]
MKKKLNILFVIPYFVPAWGGGGPVKIVFNYAKELVKRGHKVTVYTSDVKYEEERIKKNHLFIGGIEIFYLANLSNFLACRRIYLPLSFPKIFKKTVKNFDIIHCFDFRTFQNIWIRNEAIKAKIPYVVSVFGQMNRGSGILSLVKSLYDFFWGRKFLKDASLVFAQNDHEKKDLLNFGVKEEKITLLPLAIDFSEFEKLPKRGSFREKYGIKPDEFLILFLGRIHFLKGIDLLINSMPLILKKIPKAKLVIVGRDDGDLKRLKRITANLGLESKVLFIGPIYEKERIKAYTDADIFVLTPRFYEETSLASIEALACGIPIIINKRNQAPFLKKLNLGIELKDNSQEAISRSIVILCKNRISREVIREMVKKVFDIKKIINKLEEFYFKII